MNTNGAWAPLVFDATREQDRGALAALRDGGRVWAESDLVEGQAAELVRIQDPKGDAGSAELARRAAALRAEAGSTRWVYYPWSGRLFHILAPEHYDALRLARNRHKITTGEQTRLARLTIGVVGLSVGNAVTTTLALQGVGGHLKLADHDVLETSNINRVRAGLQHLGVNKAVLTARQVSEFSPYLLTTVLTEGLSDENMAAFFDDPPLDLVIDECDDFRIKLRIREEARRRRIPVVMETSDRGLIDIEHFDLEPDRPPFHGALGTLRPEDLVDMDDPQKLEVLLRLVDPFELSARASASMMEIGETLDTWPQLASDVVLGGATVCAAVKRIALGQPAPSGGRRVDLEAVLAAAPDEGRWQRPSPARPPENYAQLGAIPEDIQRIVDQAMRAPSGGNSQPWHVCWDEPHLDLLHDAERGENLMNVACVADLLGLGAMLESLVVAAGEEGYRAQVSTFPEPDAPRHFARLTLHAGAQASDRHAGFLAQRETDRNPGDASPLTEAECEALASEASAHGVGLRILGGREELSSLADQVGETDRIRMLNPAMHAELMSELRWSPEEVERTRDGIDVRTLALEREAQVALDLLSRGDVVAVSRAHGLGRGLVRMGWDAVASSSAALLFTAPTRDKADRCCAGRAIQRVWLEATRLGLGFQPIGTCLFMHDMLADTVGDVFDAEERGRIAEVMERVRGLFGGPQDEPVFLCRVHRPLERSAVRSLRRELRAVLRHSSDPEAGC